MDTSRRAHVSRADGFALGLIATGAVSVAVASVVAIVVNAIAIFRNEVTVSMPVHSTDAAALSAFDGISSAQYTAADVAFESVPGGARWLILLDGALPALATIGVCVVAWWLGVSLMRAQPFRRSMSVAIGIAACLVIAGGLIGQLCGAMGRAMLVDHLAEADAGVTDAFWVLLLDLDLAPLGWGFALALIAGAFSIGARLQNDTKGLV